MSMSFDVYYSTQKQSELGIENKTWSLDQTLSGYFETLGAVEKDSVKSGNFFSYEDKIVGRSSKDLRESLNGIKYPVTDVLVRNIYDSKTGNPFYNEYSGGPTTYEVLAVEPYVNPWNQIEYYKVLLNRSDIQGLSND